MQIFYFCSKLSHYVPKKIKKRWASHVPIYSCVMHKVVLHKENNFEFTPDNQMRAIVMNISGKL